MGKLTVQLLGYTLMHVYVVCHLLLVQAPHWPGGCIKW